MQNLWMAIFGLSLVATLFVIWPIVRRKQDRETGYDRAEANVTLYKNHLQELEINFERGDITPEVYEQLKTELSRSLLEDNEGSGRATKQTTWAVPILLVCVLAIPLATLGFYALRGEYVALELRDLMVDQAVAYRTSNSQTATDEQLGATRALINGLEDALVGEPENLKYRYLLARNQLNMNDLRGAISSYQEILTQSPEEPQVLAEFAQVLYMSSGTQLLKEIDQLTQSALTYDPENGLALSMAGIVAMQNQKPEESISYWQKAVAVFGPNSQDAQPLLAGIANARAQLAGEGSEPAVTAQASVEPSEASSPENNGLTITLNVTVEDSVTVSNDQLVYIYARAWQGPPMPLAIQRISVNQLPTTVTLHEGMAMMEGMTIAAFDQLELIARISQDGGPTAKPGDWQASIGPVTKDQLAEPFSLVIDTQVQ